MTDAMQVFVRGFHTPTIGDEYVEALTAMGFEIKCKFDGSEDSLGGIIETHIMHVDDLSVESVDEVKNRIYIHAGKDIEIRVQHRLYELSDEDTL